MRCPGAADNRAALGDINTANHVDGLDYTLNNPDTLTKYKTAAAISEKVLESVAGVFQ